MNRLLLPAAVALLIAVPMMASAAVPTHMIAQGRVMGAGNLPVDGTFAMTFSLYDGPGDDALVVWSETIASVIASGGVFAETLGAGLNPLTPDLFVDNGPLYLGMTLESGPGVNEPLALPRQSLRSVGYAFAAGRADEAAHAASADHALTADSATSATSAAQSLDLACTGCVSGAEIEADLLNSLATQTDLTDALAGLTTLGTMDCDEVGSVAMWDGVEWGCVLGGSGNEPAQPCTGEQQALQWNGDDWECVTLNQTGLSNGQAKGFEVKDSWGYVWDGVERQGVTWAVANADCLGRGARLPTITELYRVSAADKGEVANSYETNFLWSNTKWDKTGYGRVRLTSGSVEGKVQTTAGSYRCVWSNNDASYLTGNHCYGEPGDTCWTTVSGNDKQVMDMKARPRVSYLAAVNECAFYHAHVAHMLDYTENVRAGLPNGLGVTGSTWSWTSDSISYRGASLVRWQDVEVSFLPYGNNRQTWGVRGNGPYWFRCIGVTEDIGPNPNTLANEFVTDGTYLKVDSNGTTREKYADVVDGCFEAGGHIAHANDLLQLIRAGLPNGPGTGAADYVWTSDHSRYDMVNIVRWAGVDQNFTDYHSEHTTWANTNTNIYQHRCVFYPLDPDWTAPAEADCVGGCTKFEQGDGDKKRSIYVDTFDRSPKLNWTQAVETCTTVGGRLVSAHVLTELIRGGLANGNNDNIWTSDLANEGNSHSIVLKWDGVNTSFTPTYSANKTWLAANGANTQRYRCVWTNELR